MRMDRLPVVGLAVNEGADSRAGRPSRQRPTPFAALDAGSSERLQMAAVDLAAGLGRHRAWRYLAIESMKNQYRRTVLGPWWLTLQTGLYVVGLSLVFSQLLGSGLHAFLPYVALGFITFAFLQGLVRAAAQVFIHSAGYMKSTGQPLTSLVLRDVLVELLQFFHNMVIPLGFFAVGLLSPSWAALLAIPALAAITINGVLAALWLGPLVARFRDVEPAVISVLQVLIFFTPVFYRPHDLSGSRAALLNLNPFTYFVEAFRTPLLGQLPHSGTWLGLGLITTVNLVLAAIVFPRTRSKLPYWVA